MTFRFAVCDDDEVALSAIAGALVNVFEKNRVEAVVDTFLPTDDLYEKLTGNFYNAVFLDINMPKYDGIELGRRLKAEKSSIDIIYVSGAEERVFDSFSVHPYGFVRKSSFLKDVAGIAKMYTAEHTETSAATLELKAHNSILSLKINDIVYIESIRDYQYVYILGRKEPEKIRYTMEAIEKQLSPHGFIRVHKGYLINYHYIRRIDATDILTATGARIPVSKRKLQQVRAEYMELNRRRGSFILE